MGKRIRCGGRSSSSSSSSSLAILRQRIVSSKLDASFDVDAVADHLRSLHPDYSRLALRPFTLQVRKTLDFFHRRHRTLENDDDEDRCRKTMTRKADESEERLLAAEVDHIRKRPRKNWNANASSLVSSDDSTAISEVGNAVLEARMDPEFDLTKSMLRNNYSKKSKSGKKEGHNMEIDAVDEKKSTMTMGSSKNRSEHEIAALKDKYLTKGEVVINEGPRFKDLGGMKGVLKELTRKVLVPLCHPQVPRKLGVRPISGILLHGPPGCGKTKLALAIANETGVPFYKISAPEVISGISAVQIVQPSSRREGFSSIPSTRWEDVGGLNSLRKEFERYSVQRIKNPEDYEELGVDMDVGFLLYGPPGCGKTLIAKAVANEAGANFIHIKGPEILSKYVGESELAVRTIFSRARLCSPCILFFDEVDALTTMRGKEGGWVVERLLNQLLIELDGVDQRKDVYVIGATNRLDVMDPAVLRPGRFGRILYTPLPTAEERGLILKALARKRPVAADVDLDAFGRKEACHNLTGADLSNLINKAAMASLEEKQMAIDSGSSYARPLIIETSHFEKALVMITPSVSEKQRIYYETLSKNYRTN